MLYSGTTVAPESVFLLISLSVFLVPSLSLFACHPITAVPRTCPLLALPHHSIHIVSAHQTDSTFCSIASRSSPRLGFFVDRLSLLLVCRLYPLPFFLVAQSFQGFDYHPQSGLKYIRLLLHC
ncbi:hypothetical protein FA13DRAFT_1415430 [Coprinellus micaceus]|uniref:Uncharacterized protein n=1 Tax=Coprinellus micaceus TaxID=71717 RepID=A0A4Y7SN81_COPMI|nr:hypothetical protein FA13DRAFT_1415430 [Coprinellus micaceus]